MNCSTSHTKSKHKSALSVLTSELSNLMHYLKLQRIPWLSEKQTIQITTSFETNCRKTPDEMQFFKWCEHLHGRKYRLFRTINYYIPFGNFFFLIVSKCESITNWHLCVMSQNISPNCSGKRHKFIRPWLFKHASHLLSRKSSWPSLQNNSLYSSYILHISSRKSHCSFYSEEPHSLLDALKWCAREEGTCYSLPVPWFSDFLDSWEISDFIKAMCLGITLKTGEGKNEVTKSQHLLSNLKIKI